MFSDYDEAQLPRIHENRLKKYAGQLWITDKDLGRCNYHDPAEGDVIRVQAPYGTNEEDKFYELAGRTRKKGDVTGWWLLEIVVDDPYPNWPTRADDESVRG